MANRFWVGGTGTWDASTTTQWSTTSGGGGGAAVPTSSDDVYLDGNSGTGIITLSANAFIHSFTTTGYGGTFVTTGGQMTLIVYTNVVLNSTFTGDGNLRIQMNGSSNCTITSNGANFPGYFLINATVGNTVGLADNFIGSYVVYHYQGIFSTNNYNMRCAIYYTNVSGSTRVINFGSSTIEILSGPTNFAVASGTLTLNPGTSTLNFTSSGTQAFCPNGLTVYNVSINKTSGYGIYLAPSGTYNNLSIVGSGNSLHVWAGTTQTVNSFSGPSTPSANMICYTGGSTYTLSRSSGTNTVSNLAITGCIATGGATWIADASCSDGGSNTGWTFQAPLINVFDTLNISENITAKIATSLSVSVFDSVNTSENKTLTPLGLGNISVFDTLNSSVKRITPPPPLFPYTKLFR